jgi:hypothetical protein
VVSPIVPPENLQGTSSNFGILNSVSNEIATTNELVNQPTQSEIEDKAWNDAPLSNDILERIDYEEMANFYNFKNDFSINPEITGELIETNNFNDEQIIFLKELDKFKNNLIEAPTLEKKFEIIKNEDSEWSPIFSSILNNEETDINRIIGIISYILRNLADISADTNSLSSEIKKFMMYISGLLNKAHNKETFNCLVEGEVIGQRPILTILRLFFTTCYDYNYSINALPLNSNECFEWYKKYRETEDRITNLEKILINESLDDKLNKILLRIDDDFKKKFKDVTEVDFDYAYRTASKQMAEKKEKIKEERIEKERKNKEAEDNGFVVVGGFSGGGIKTKEKSNDIKYIIILSLIIFSLSFVKR